MKKNTYNIEKLVGNSFRIFNTKYPKNTVGVMRIRGNKAEVYDEYTIATLDNEVLEQLAEKAMTM